MKINLANLVGLDGKIKELNAQEVKNPINFNSDNSPTDDGLFSTIIFGQIGSNDRKTRWGYINLKKKFLHPIMYKMLKELSRDIEKCILGQGRYSINENGQLYEDKEGRNGISFIVENIDKIVFKETGSKRREDRLKLLSNLGDKIFVDKWLVIPCMYRDYKVPEKENTRIEAVGVLNDLYAKIIRLCSTIDDDDAFAFSGVNTEAQVQVALNDIYKMLTGSLAKKTGIIHQGALGKSIDYATRSVISAPRHKTQSWKDNPIKFGYTGVPLSQICVLFYPFFVKYVQDMIEPFKEELELKDIDVDEEFSEEKIKKMVNLFFKAPDMRFKPLKVHNKHGKEVELSLFKEDLGRPFSLTDLVYIASEDIIKDKHVYVTRYPIEQYQNIYPSKISILSTQSTHVQKIHDRVFPNYPNIYPDYPGKLSTEDVWVDTVRPNNSYLSSLGGDYDGDTVSLRAVFTQEANMEADRFIHSKANLLDQSGKNPRELGNEGIQALFSLTRKIEK